jgi:Zn-dependent protease
MDQLSDIQRLAVWVLPVLFAITVHEVAHGWMARKLGDNTAFMLGRITLNPIKHIDIVGTIIVPLVMFFLGGLLFGWAKPVPVSWKNLKNPRRDMALVAVAGPGANLIMAILWAVVMRIGFELQAYPWFSIPMLYMGMAGITINAVLMILNLLPILPLDGGRILSSFLPPKLEAQFAKMEPWGLVILLVLIFTGVLGAILGPGINLVGQLAYALVGLT